MGIIKGGPNAGIPGQNILGLCQNYSKRVGKKRKAPASGIRAAKLAKAKRSGGPVRRRETRAARKRRREEAGDGDGEEDFKALSGDDLEELAGDPTESEFEAVPGPTAAAGPRRETAAETAKMCAGDKVR